MAGSYNWHPAVHHLHFDETLYFVMIRLHEPLHRPVAEQVTEVLEAAGIQHACAYPLFGWWDALVRVWLTPPSYLRLLEVLSDEHKPAHNIEDYRGFSTSEIRYFWRLCQTNLLAPTKKVKTAIAGNTADIEKVAREPECVDSEGWKSLKKEGLIFDRPEMDEGAVKFYTCLERTSDRMPPKEEVEAIIRAMKATSMSDGEITMLQRSSLYCGDGSLADYLVRSVANSFDDVLALAESFDEHLGDTGLRPMTLMVANPDAVYESDHVNDRRHFTPSDHSTRELLELDAGVLGEFSSSDRQQLNTLVIEACEFAKQDDGLREILLKILRASALNNHDDLQTALYYLLIFEPEFKRRLRREFGEVFGDDWVVKARNLCLSSERWKEHAEKEMGKNVANWTLGTYLTTARAACELSPQFRGRLVSQLGDDWDPRATDLLDLRNDLAHGRVYETPRLDSFDADWSTYLRRSMKAAVFWWRSRNDDYRRKD